MTTLYRVGVKVGRDLSQAGLDAERLGNLLGNQRGIAERRNSDPEDT